eukprot:TRINITY_DN2106_c0_g2_i1.p1 TRINITY_DN2106_c0_g2~~TRINITY_DN2106_c0_g2_i1.p1  ORF type:complete len:124 (+),score=28.28 TRINITY_DN2106_c0_g2_i1:99-470(+)
MHTSYSRHEPSRGEDAILIEMLPTDPTHLDNLALKSSISSSKPLKVDFIRNLNLDDEKTRKLTILMCAIALFFFVVILLQNSPSRHTSCPNLVNFSSLKRHLNQDIQFWRSEASKWKAIAHHN